MATALNGLKKLSDVVDNDVAKWWMVYDEFVKKVNAIDTSKLINKTDYNAKIKNIEDKIPNITGLATTAVFTVVENNIPNVSNLVKKQIMMQKYETLKKYFTNSDYNRFTNDILDTKVTENKLIDEYDLDEKIKNISNKRRNRNISNKSRIKIRTR